MFTRVALKEGPVDPAELVEAYITANKAMWNVQKEMKANMDAASILGTSSQTIKESLARMGTKDFNYVDQGRFQSYRPSDNVIKGIYTNARKLGIPNAWVRARAIINNIARLLNRLRTDPGSEFPDFVNPLRVVGGKDDRVSITPNVPIQTQEVSEEVVRTSALLSNIFSSLFTRSSI